HERAVRDRYEHDCETADHTRCDGRCTLDATVPDRDRHTDHVVVRPDRAATKDGRIPERKRGAFSEYGRYRDRDHLDFRTGWARHFFQQGLVGVHWPPNRTGTGLWLDVRRGSRPPGRLPGRLHFLVRRPLSVACGMAIATRGRRVPLDAMHRGAPYLSRRRVCRLYRFVLRHHRLETCSRGLTRPAETGKP